MELKVRALDGGEQKSTQQIEKELQEKHDQEQAAAAKAAEDAATPAKAAEVGGQGSKPTEVELKEEDVLSYIGKRYNKQITSFDELMAERKEAEALPEDVVSYLKYKKETGRGFDDFIKLKKDYDAVDPDELLKDYLVATQEGIDREDAEVLLEEYRYDDQVDDESTINKIKIAKKKVVAEAKKYFNTQKEKYKAPLESSGPFISQEEKDEYEKYKQYLGQAKTQEQDAERKRNWFVQKTDELFGKEFKGFEFDINNKKISFTPADAAELKKLQSTPSNFINKFLDENGLMKDATGYHRSLAVAMNPEKFAKFFYEQGQADATEATVKGIKNINMSERRSPENAKPIDGIQVKVVNPDSGKSLKIRSAKRV